MFVRGLTALALGFAAAGVQAAPVLINQDIRSGTAAFDAAVVAAGGQPATQGLRNLAIGVSHWDFDDFTIRATDGTPRFVDRDYGQMSQHRLPGALSGWAIGISVNAPVERWGLTFEFASPVSAFGLEVGDWGTCCHASGLYIAFDDAPALLVAAARNSGDNPGIAAYGAYTNFVGALDTGGSFSTVTFYGSGVGEYLVAGGTIRYAAPPVGRNDVDGDDRPLPEPAGWMLVLLALAAMDLATGSVATSLLRCKVRLRERRLCGLA